MEDFRKNSSDQTQSSKRCRKDTKLLNRRLKKDAIPSIFSGLPSYFAFDDVHSQTGMALSSSRHENAAKLLEEQGEKFLKTDQLKNFDDLSSSLAKEQLPQDFLMHYTDSGIDLICLSQEQPPTISGTIHIDNSKSVFILINNFYHVPLTSTL